MSDVFETLKINDKPLMDITKGPKHRVMPNGDVFDPCGTYIGNAFEDKGVAKMAEDNGYQMGIWTEGTTSFNVWEPIERGIENDLPDRGTENDLDDDPWLEEDEDYADDKATPTMNPQNIRKLIEQVLEENGYPIRKTTTNSGYLVKARKFKHR
jgi:hypothetical protein